MPRTWEDRVREYVDSPKMIHRLRTKTSVVARILGTQGVYRVGLNRKNGEGNCNCPYWDPPCKHIEALKRTWKKRPSSFPDLEDLLRAALSGRTRAQLVDLIRAMAVYSPPSLQALGAVGFRENPPSDDEDPEGFLKP